MKQGTSALVAAAIFLGGASAVVAQPLPPVEGPRVIYGSQAHYGGRGGPPPSHAPFDGAMPSYEVAAILRSRRISSARRADPARRLLCRVGGPPER